MKSGLYNKNGTLFCKDKYFLKYLCINIMTLVFFKKYINKEHFCYRTACHCQNT